MGTPMSDKYAKKTAKQAEIKGAAELELGGMGVAGPSRKVILENLLPSATKSY